MGLGTTLDGVSSSLLLLDVVPFALLPCCRSCGISKWCPAASEGTAGRAVDDDDVPSMPGVGVELGLDELLVNLRLAFITPLPLRPWCRVPFPAARTVCSLAVNTSGECTPLNEVRPSSCIGDWSRGIAAARAVAIDVTISG